MKLTAKSRYAARILLELALQESDTPIPTAMLSKQTEVSVQFIEQIMRPLKKAELVNSVRGANGGHMLAKAAAEISLGDIIRAVAGPINIANCLDCEDSCNRTASCLTRSAWHRASRAIEKELDSISLQELINSPECTPIPDMQEVDE